MKIWDIGLKHLRLWGEKLHFERKYLNQGTFFMPFYFRCRYVLVVKACNRNDRSVTGKKKNTTIDMCLSYKFRNWNIYIHFIYPFCLHFFLRKSMSFMVRVCYAPVLYFSFGLLNWNTSCSISPNFIFHITMLRKAWTRLINTDKQVNVTLLKKILFKYINYF